MAFEIEHKYLVDNETYRSMATHKYHIFQGYLSREPARTVRIRTKDDIGYITIKGITKGDIRHEFEYDIPYKDALQLLQMCIPPIIEKVRYIVPFEGHIWEIDEFKGELNHVVIAEIELNESNEKYELPPFVGQNITGDVKYYNSNIHHNKNTSK